VGQLNKSQVRFYLNSSKFFVLSSDYETFGVVLIEAISMGKPVVSTRSGGVNDIVAPWNGILVDNNSQGLANGILLMASNYLNYNNKMVRSMGIKLFSGYAVANKYLKYYNEV
jgi:glycosyltransferase involved in cell wall biosynthesis